MAFKLGLEGCDGLDGQRGGRKVEKPGSGRLASGTSGPSEWPPGGEEAEK